MARVTPAFSKQIQIQTKEKIAERSDVGILTSSTFVDSVCCDFGIAPNEGNAKNFKEGAVHWLLFTLDVLHHDVGVQRLDDLDRLGSLVLLELLAIEQVLLEVCWKRPETIGMDCGYDVLVVAAIVTLEERSNENLRVGIFIFSVDLW